MNKQRKVVITITYNEMGIIIDTKAEEITQPNLQPTCNQLATDCISRQAAIDLTWKDPSYSDPLNVLTEVRDGIKALPSAQPELAQDLPNACTDAISRQAAIDKITEYGSGDVTCMSVGELKRRIEQLPSAQPEQRWIPCDKGEPDEDIECWVTVKTTDTLYRGNFTKRYGERRDKGFITSGGFMWWNTALAWMPIYEPEPYRPEGDDKHEG